jgi:hypothetical protein
MSGLALEQRIRGFAPPTAQAWSLAPRTSSSASEVLSLALEQHLRIAQLALEQRMHKKAPGTAHVKDITSNST